MKRTRQPSSTQSGQSSHMRPQVFFDLFRTASSQTITRAAIAVAVACVPLAVLSALRGGASVSKRRRSGVPAIGDLQVSRLTRRET